jgi:hypothetical protein
MQIFNKNTIKCDRCEKQLSKKDKSYCFHTEEQEVYICEECVKEVYNEYSKVIKIEEQN